MRSQRKRSRRTRLPSPPRNFPKKPRTIPLYEQNPPQDPPNSPENGPKPSKWLVGVLRKMNVTNDPKLIIEKRLDLEDVDPIQNRLSIPLKDVIYRDFLTCCELKILRDSEINSKGVMGVAAILVDQRTKNWQVCLKRGTDSETKESIFFLSGEWKKIVEGNGLRDDDNITLWSFWSSAGILHFALDFAGDSMELTP